MECGSVGEIGTFDPGGHFPREQESAPVRLRPDSEREPFPDNEALICEEPLDRRIEGAVWLLACESLLDVGERPESVLASCDGRLSAEMSSVPSRSRSI